MDGAVLVASEALLLQPGGAECYKSEQHIVGVTPEPDALAQGRTKAAATIHRRLLELLPDGIATPEALDALTDAQLRQVGMSRQKSSYVRDLSAKAASGELHLDRLAEMTDDQVIEALTKVKGLGRWSAEMFLMFRLRRPDVLPVDDLGIVNAIHRLYKLRKRPDAKRIRRLGEAWRPYRTVACWYLWRSLENTPLDTPKPVGLRQKRIR